MIVKRQSLTSNECGVLLESILASGMRDLNENNIACADSNKSEPNLVKNKKLEQL
ncbi:MAG TPA: hypothetical protein PKD32_08195 [Saprospiraceae bacterium]|nr:hypothetical protein [Saprospiraceae bacterium]